MVGFELREVFNERRGVVVERLLDGFGARVRVRTGLGDRNRKEVERLWNDAQVQIVIHEQRRAVEDLAFKNRGDVHHADLPIEYGTKLSADPQSVGLRNTSRHCDAIVGERIEISLDRAEIHELANLGWVNRKHDVRVVEPFIVQRQARFDEPNSSCSFDAIDVLQDVGYITRQSSRDEVVGRTKLVVERGSDRLFERRSNDRHERDDRNAERQRDRGPCGASRVAVSVIARELACDAARFGWDKPQDARGGRNNHRRHHEHANERHERARGR